MKTQSSMLSSLAIAALATVTLNSSEALAKGGMGGGMRSFSAVRTSPVVVKQFRTVSTPTVKKLTTTKLTSNVDKRSKVTLSPQPLPPGRLQTTPGEGVGPTKTTLSKQCGPHCFVVDPPGTPKPPVDLFPPGKIPPVLATAPGVINPPGGVHPVPPLPLPPGNPPVVTNPPAPPVVMTPPASASMGVAAAPAAAEPAGCTYERSVRKLPDGGLQRVIVKVCPDVIAQ